MRGGITAQLATDGGGSTVESTRDTAQGETLVPQGGNGVSFSTGELEIFHVSNPFLPDEEADSIAGSPLSLGKDVALSLANRDP